MSKRYQNKSGGIGKVIACLMLVVIIVFGAIWGTGYAITGKANPAEWGLNTPPAELPDVPQIEYEDPDVPYGKNGYLIVNTSPETTAPVALAAMTRQVNGNVAEVLTATVSPVDADIFGITWESSDSSSVVVTPIDGDKLSARLTCVKSFDERITITCTIYSIKTISATCTVDCLVSPGAAVEIEIRENDQRADKIGFGKTYTCVGIPGQWYGGTLMGDLRVKTWSVCLSTEVINAITAIIGEQYWDVDLGSGDGDTITFTTPKGCFLSGSTSEEDFRKAFAQVCHNKDNAAKVEATIEYCYGDKVYKTYNVNAVYGFDSSTYVKPADGLTILPDNPVLGT